MLVLKSVNFEQQQFEHHRLEQTFYGQTEWVIGRSSSCDLVLPGLEVSRVHARIVYVNGDYFFVDAGSTSGSLVNGKHVIEDDRQRLCPGDLLQIGETFLYVEEVAAATAIATTSPNALLMSSKPWTEQELICCCQRIVDETPDVKTFYFTAEPPILFSYLPGQFVNLEVEIEGQPVLRSYSISSSPTRPHHLSLTIKRVPSPPDQPELPAGLVSNWLHDHLQVGDRVKFIGGPLGHFSCLPQLPAKLLLISAGSGITPMMSMTRWIQDTLVSSDVVFLHSARTSDDIIFCAELEAIAAQMPNFHLFVTLTQQPQGRSWMGLTGRVSESMLNLVAPDLLERSVFVCGPEAFMQNVRSRLETMQFPMQNYQEESFGGKKKTPIQVVSLPEAAAERGAGAIDGITGFKLRNPSNPQLNGQKRRVTGAPELRFVKSDRSLTASGTDSILELAEQGGIQIRNACRTGSCGACKIRLLKGKVRYDTPPAALSEADQKAGYALACVAHPSEDLEIEA